MVYDFENLKNFTNNIFYINDLNNTETKSSILNLIVDFIKNKKGKKVSIFSLENSNKSLLEILINNLSDSKRLNTLKNISYYDNENDFDNFVNSDINYSWFSWFY